MLESELRIYNINLEKALRVLAETGFEEKETQLQENYFLRQKQNPSCELYIRVRVKHNGKQRIATFTVKQEVGCRDDIHTRQEYEVRIEDDKTFIQAMRLIGFEMKKRIDKKRIILSKKGFADINIDIFDERKIYIEIEHKKIEVIRKTQELIKDKDIYNEHN